MAMNLTSLVKIRQWDQLQFLNAPATGCELNKFRSSISHLKHFETLKRFDWSKHVETVHLGHLDFWPDAHRSEVSRNRLQSLEPLGALRHLLHLNASHNLLIRTHGASWSCNAVTKLSQRKIITIHSNSGNSGNSVPGTWMYMNINEYRWYKLTLTCKNMRWMTHCKILREIVVMSGF